MQQERRFSPLLVTRTRTQSSRCLKKNDAIRRHFPAMVVYQRRGHPGLVASNDLRLALVQIQDASSAVRFRERLEFRLSDVRDEVERTRLRNTTGRALRGSRPARWITSSQWLATIVDPPWVVGAQSIFQVSVGTNKTGLTKPTTCWGSFASQF